MFSIRPINQLFSDDLRCIVHPSRASQLLQRNTRIDDIHLHTATYATGQLANIRELIQSGDYVLLDRSQLRSSIFSGATNQLSASLPFVLKARLEWLVEHGHLHEHLSRQDLAPKDTLLNSILSNITADKNPDLYEIFYTDFDGNREFEPMVGDDIWLVVKSREMVGELIDIDLSDNSWDLEYQEKPVENHQLPDIKLTSDIEHIPLRIVATGPQILECYFTDMDDRLIEELQVGDELLFVFRTKNMIGKMVDIDLEDGHRDFEYQGAALEDDTLKDYTISSGTEKIPLLIMPQGVQ